MTPVPTHLGSKLHRAHPDLGKDRPCGPVSSHARDRPTSTQWLMGNSNLVRGAFSLYSASLPRASLTAYSAEAGGGEGM